MKQALPPIRKVFSQPSQVLLCLARLGICAGYAWLAWGQLAQRAWLEPAVVDHYVQESLFAHVFTSYRGFIPLVEILGGFTWLAQLGAPLLLWHRHFAKYLALVLIVLQGLLMAFTPTYFWNTLLVASLILFLPSEWFTIEKIYWRQHRMMLHRAWRNFCFFLVTTTLLFTIFERNIAQQFSLFEKIQSKPIEVAYRIISKPFVEIGNLILFNSIWKMYSPTWRHVVWIEWYYQQAGQSMQNWPQENFSPDYRMHRRTWGEALWTDFKQEKVFIGMLSGANEKTIYGQYLCREISQRTGVKPVSVHPEIYSFDIRGPDEQWSLKNQAYEQKQVLGEIACD
jgi:hypothetical protein